MRGHEAVHLDPLHLITPRNWQQRGDARHLGVKRGVKASHLRQLWMTVTNASINSISRGR